MEAITRRTRKKFVLTIIAVVLLVAVVSWGILEAVNRQQIGAPADISEVHHTADHSPEFAEYLEDQKEYEAHFVTLASSIKDQEQERLTRALAITTFVVVTVGAGAAFYVARKLTEPVEEAYKSQERFIQDAAHELRNPLAAMNVALQQTKEKSPLVTIFRRQTNRLIQINEDLLFLERRNKQEPSATNLSGLIQDVVEELQPIASKKQVAIGLKTDPDISKVMVSGDYIRLVKNIIDNAIKYSHPESTVEIAQTRSKSHVKIIVKDKGIGIPKKDLENIGSRFFRASNTGEIDGTGLGLAIVEKILNVYGGSKTIESRPNKGTTVTITLPA